MKVECDGYFGTGIPVKMSRTPGAVHSKPPRFGAHGREILIEAGFSDDEIEHLVTAEIVGENRRKS